MKTKNHISQVVEIAAALENQETVQWYCSAENKWFDCHPDFALDFGSFYYRVKEYGDSKKFLDIEDIWGKTLVQGNMRSFVVNSRSGDKIISIHEEGTVESLHNRGWRVASPVSLRDEDSTSLCLED